MQLERETAITILIQSKLESRVFTSLESRISSFGFSVRLLANVEVFCVGHSAAMVGPGEVLRATKSHHKHTISRFLGNNVVWNGIGQDHLTRPPPKAAVCV